MSESYASYVRPLVRNVGRELSVDEIDAVSGAATTYIGTVCMTCVPNEGCSVPQGDDTRTQTD